MGDDFDEISLHFAPVHGGRKIPDDRFRTDLVWPEMDEDETELEKHLIRLIVLHGLHERDPRELSIGTQWEMLDRINGQLGIKPLKQPPRKNSMARPKLSKRLTQLLANYDNVTSTYAVAMEAAGDSAVISREITDKYMQARSDLLERLAMLEQAVPGEVKLAEETFVIESTSRRIAAQAMNENLGREEFTPDDPRLTRERMETYAAALGQIHMNEDDWADMESTKAREALQRACGVEPRNPDTEEEDDDEAGN